MLSCSRSDAPPASLFARAPLCSRVHYDLIHHILSPVRTPKVFAKAQHTRGTSHVYASHGTVRNNKHAYNEIRSITLLLSKTHTSGVKRCLVSHINSGGAMTPFSCSFFFSRRASQLALSLSACAKW
jgi:hypothetical protein